MGTVTALYTAAAKRGPVARHDAVQVRLGCGIVGDRHYRANNQPARQITLIERERVHAFAVEQDMQLDPAMLRRNVLTSAADLNALVGREFQVGGIRLRGIELCEPCMVVGRLLQRPGLPPARVIRALLGQGGLRAEILDTGVIRVGDPVRV